jgi:hypothetical protein
VTVNGAGEKLNHKRSHHAWGEREKEKKSNSQDNYTHEVLETNDLLLIRAT